MRRVCAGRQKAKIKASPAADRAIGIVSAPSQAMTSHPSVSLAFPPWRQSRQPSAPAHQRKGEKNRRLGKRSRHRHRLGVVKDVETAIARWQNEHEQENDPAQASLRHCRRETDERPDP